MRSRHRVIEEERLLRSCGPLFEDRDCLIRKSRQNLGHLEAGRDGAGPVEHSSRFGLAAGLRRRFLHRVVVLEVEIRVHVQRGRNAEVVVEAVVCRIRMERLAVIGFLIAPQSQMPFPYTGRVVSLLLQHARHGEPVVFNQVRRIAPQHALLQSGSPAIPARHYAVARRRADRGWRVHVGEAHALACQPVRIGGWDGGLRVVAFQIAPAQIVGQDIDDIRRTANSERSHRADEFSASGYAHWRLISTPLVEMKYLTSMFGFSHAGIDCGDFKYWKNWLVTCAKWASCPTR